MQKPQKPRFYSTEENLQPEELVVEVTPTPATKTMAFGYGFDDILQTWRRLRADFVGRQRVTMGVATQSPINVQNIAPADTLTHLLFDVNSQRQYAFIINQGFGSLYFGFSSADVTANRSIVLPSGTGVEIDGWTGQIYYKMLDAATQLTAFEV